MYYCRDPVPRDVWEIKRHFTERVALLSFLYAAFSIVMYRPL